MVDLEKRLNHFSTLCQLQDFTVDLEKSSAGGLGFTVVGCASTTGGRYIKAGVQDPALSDGRLRPRDRLIQVSSLHICPKNPYRVNKGEKTVAFH